MSTLYELTLIPLFILLGLYIFLYLRFQQSNYRHVSRNSFFKTFINKGFWGEYRIFATLEKLAKPHHILTNLYIPRKDGTTTEIDLIYLSIHMEFLLLSLKITVVGYLVMRSKNIGHKPLKISKNFVSLTLFGKTQPISVHSRKSYQKN